MVASKLVPVHACNVHKPGGSPMTRSNMTRDPMTRHVTTRLSITGSNIIWDLIA